MPDYSNPSKACDLVMKGGLTSGIVYPAAVLELAKDYKFHSVGGTSAGAIAAAVTAAAEAGRSSGGFARLEKVAQEIAGSGFLLKIFQASGPAKSVMNLFVSLLARRPKNPGILQKLWFFGPVVYWQLLCCLPCVFLIGAVLGAPLLAGIVYLMAWLGHVLGESFGDLPRTSLVHSPTLCGVVTIGAILGFLVGSIVGPIVKIAYLLLRYLPRENFFGICTGYIKGDSTVLTNWLHKNINELFGKKEADSAVTFAEFEAADVKFKAISTNLAQNRPYIFPREPEGFHLVFNQRELEHLFPPQVIDVLIRQPATPYGGPKLPAGYFYLPERNDLPVVVATRMSLSFPVLISAIPMYEVKPTSYQAKRKEAEKAGRNETDMQLAEADLHKHWFSDGGICSNFPIGLFDVWLPTHPTFGINLNYLKAGQKIGSQVPAENVPTSDADESPTKDDVYLPLVSDRMRSQWNSIEDPFGFLGAILDSARNHRDSLQSMLPSYSERIVQVWLDPEEGGMNLTMDLPKINSLIQKGGKAGQLLGGMNFEEHRCMRLRVLLKVLCKEIENLHHSYPTLDKYEAITTSPDTWCGRKDAAFWAKVHPYLAALSNFANEWTADDSCGSVFDRPTFEGDLHIHPKI